MGMVEGEMEGRRAVESGQKMGVEGAIMGRGSRPCLTTNLHALNPFPNTAKDGKGTLFLPFNLNLDTLRKSCERPSR